MLCIEMLEIKFQVQLFTAWHIAGALACVATTARLVGGSTTRQKAQASPSLLRKKVGVEALEHKRPSHRHTQVVLDHQTALAAMRVSKREACLDMCHQPVAVFQYGVKPKSAMGTSGYLAKVLSKSAFQLCGKAV